MRYFLKLCPKLWRRKMTIIPAEQFVPAITGERDSHLAPGEAADQVGWNLRRISEGLIVHRGQQRNDFARFPDRNIMFLVNSAEVICHAKRVRGFIIAGLFEADRESADRDSRIFLIQSANCRAVDTT